MYVYACYVIIICYVCVCVSATHVISNVIILYVVTARLRNVVIDDRRHYVIVVRVYVGGGVGSIDTEPSNILPRLTFCHSHSCIAKGYT